MRLKIPTVVIVVLIISLVLTSCAPGQVMGPTFTPLPTITNTPQPTVTNTPTATPTPDVMIELMKQINLFLNSEEPYRDDKDLYWKIFRPYRTQNTPKLGLIDANVEYGTVNMQGVFLGYIDTTDGIVLFVGFQDNGGERFVTPLKLYDQKFEIYKDTNSGFQYLVRTDDYTNFIGEPIYINTKSGVTDFLSTKIGQVFGIQLTLMPLLPLDEETEQVMVEIGWTDPELTINQINDFWKNYVEVNKDLCASLWVPSSEDWNILYGGLTISQNLQKMGEASGTAIRITTAEDIIRVLQIEWLPCPDYLMGSSG